MGAIGELLAKAKNLVFPADLPPYFVRVASRHADARVIIHAARTEPPPWDANLRNRVQTAIFEPQDTDISVYSLKTRDRFDAGHALGVLAGSIATDDFDSRRRASYLKRFEIIAGPKPSKPPVDEFGRPLVSFVFPSTLLPKNCVRSTPTSNANFCPADDGHFDVCPPNVDDLAARFLEGLHRGEILYTFIRPADYRVQAAVALSHCVERFGALTGGNPPKKWRNGTTLTAGEQLERLRVLAGDLGLQSRAEANRP